LLLTVVQRPAPFRGRCARGAEAALWNALKRARGRGGDGHGGTCAVNYIVMQRGELVAYACRAPAQPNHGESQSRALLDLYQRYFVPSRFNGSRCRRSEHSRLRARLESLGAVVETPYAPFHLAVCLAA
jgi:hypothetical protein